MKTSSIHQLVYPTMKFFHSNKDAVLKKLGTPIAMEINSGDIKIPSTKPTPYWNGFEKKICSLMLKFYQLNGLWPDRFIQWTLRYCSAMFVCFSFDFERPNLISKGLAEYVK